MSLHLMAFESSIADGSVLTKCNALQSVWETIQNNNLVVAALNNIVGAYAYGPNMVRAQLQSPSLLSPGYPDLTPFSKAVPGAAAPAPWQDFLKNPLKLSVNEQLSAYTANGGSGSESELVALLLCDTVPTPVTGRIITLKLTGTTTLVENAWTEVPLTFEDNIPVGNYQVVGARFQSAGALLGRIGYPGFGYRVGGLAVQSLNDADNYLMRMGMMGSWFTFASTVTLTADFLSSSADTAQVVYLDLIGPQ